MGDRINEVSTGVSGKRDTGISIRARCAMAAVVIVAELADAWLIDWVARTSPHDEIRAMARAFTVSMLAGVLCLCAVIVLSWRRRPLGSRTGWAADLLLLIAWLKLVSISVVLVLLGAFTDLNGLQLLVTAVVESSIVVWLAAGTRRHVNRHVNRASEPAGMARAGR
jgi:peptidoglycan/LPS O-acetylase OafA/YrhL